jgi:hypothetical protein
MYHSVSRFILNVWVALSLRQFLHHFPVTIPNRIVQTRVSSRIDEGLSIWSQTRGRTRFKVICQEYHSEDECDGCVCPLVTGRREDHCTRVTYFRFDQNVSSVRSVGGFVFHPSKKKNRTGGFEPGGQIAKRR